MLRSGQEGERKEIILCSLAHSHIKSNSFIFTFIHPGRAGEGWLGRRGSLKDFSGRGRRLSGEVQGGRGLCQRVAYLVLRAPAQEFSLLIRAGQGVAAAVTTHVECGVYGVGEVGGLQGDRGFGWDSEAGLHGPGTPPPTSVPSSNSTPQPQPLVPALETASFVFPAHLVGVQGKVSVQ